jgi:hypothetical protein
MMMKTPFDAAIRVQRREIDAMGAAITSHANRLSQIERMHEELRVNAAKEAAVASNDLSMPAHAYMDRIRAEQARISAESAVQNARLAQLRIQAASAYGTCRTIESAADDFRTDAGRRLANSEQAQLDDSAAVAYLKAKALREGRQR